jgi:hypothetical protein
MAMTKKDYELIVDTLASFCADNNITMAQQLDLLNKFDIVLSEDNSRFNYNRFHDRFCERLIIEKDR